jgi:DNA-binding response OmpR family regulator
LLSPSHASVLVVEDDADLRYLFRITLTTAGFRVREASDGYQALVALEESSPDVMVLDLGLPRVSGFSVLEEIAARADLRKPGVVVVTGLSDIDPLDVEVLHKPVDPPVLVAAVRNVVRRSGRGATT